MFRKFDINSISTTRPIYLTIGLSLIFPDKIASPPLIPPSYLFFVSTLHLHVTFPAPRYTNSTLRLTFHAITFVRMCPLNLGKIKGVKKDSHRVIISILLDIYFSFPLVIVKTEIWNCENSSKLSSSKYYFI